MQILRQICEFLIPVIFAVVIVLSLTIGCLRGKDYLDNYPRQYHISYQMQADQGGTMVTDRGVELRGYFHKFDVEELRQFILGQEKKNRPEMQRPVIIGIFRIQN